MDKKQEKLNEIHNKKVEDTKQYYKKYINKNGETVLHKSRNVRTNRSSDFIFLCNFRKRYTFAESNLNRLDEIDIKDELTRKLNDYIIRKQYVESLRDLRDYIFTQKKSEYLQYLKINSPREYESFMELDFLLTEKCKKYKLTIP